MSKLRKHSKQTLPFVGLVLALAGIALLSGCVIEERAYSPPPRPYAPPPPPPQAYAEPGGGAEIEARATEAPPPLPDYEQPPCPEDGYLWTPGYWGWSGGGYYWVPGTWVQPPRVGFLWTPGYWAFLGGVYGFHVGYWGPHVGFYGGVNYGFGYFGVGFAGGRWEGDSFAYNRTVNNVNVTNIHNTYNETVINNVNVTKVSYNGGAGGTAAAPTAQERAAAHERHEVATPLQRQHIQEAARNPALAAAANGGHPAIAATPKPAAFNAPGVVRAKGALASTALPPGRAAAMPPARASGAPPHVGNGPTGLPPGARPTVTHGPPNAYTQPQGVRAQPPRPPPQRAQAPRPPPPRAQPPKSDKREPDGRR